MGYTTAQDNWSKEVKKDMPKEDKLRLWIKWAARVASGQSEQVHDFTTRVEKEVFGC